jgi:hypothetical protein
MATMRVPTTITAAPRTRVETRSNCRQIPSEQTFHTPDDTIRKPRGGPPRAWQSEEPISSFKIP